MNLSVSTYPLGFAPKRLVFLKKSEIDPKLEGKGFDISKLTSVTLDESGGKGKTLDQLRVQMGQLGDSLAPLVSDQVRDEYNQVKEGLDQGVTIDFLKNHPEFRPQERQEALRIYNKIQEGLKKGEITQDYADELVKELVLNKINAKMIEGSLKFGQEYLNTVNKLLTPGKEALGKSISKTDLDYWVEHYILPSEFTLKEDMPNIQAQLAKKLKRRQEDKAFYDEKVEIAKKRKIKLGGDLDKLSSEKAFLEAEVPKRHDYLRALVLALHEWDQETKAYKARVNKAVKDGWMNDSTAAEFLESFALITPDKRKLWLEDKTEWDKREKIREELDALPEGSKNRTYMEEMFGLLGFSQFEALFKKNKKIHEDYAQALEGYKNDKRYNLRERTYLKYLNWSQEQSYPVLMDAYGKLDHFAQMGKLKELQKRMDKLSDEQKNELEKEYNEAGYEARKRLLDKAEKESPETAGAEVIPLGVLKNISSDVIQKHLHSGLGQLTDVQFNHLDQILNNVYKRSKGIEGVQSFADGFTGHQELIAQQEAQRIQEMEREKSSNVQLMGFQQQIKAQRQQAQPPLMPQVQENSAESFNVSEPSTRTHSQVVPELAQGSIDSLRQPEQGFDSLVEKIPPSNNSGYVVEEFSKKSLQKVGSQDGFTATNVSGLKQVSGKGSRSALVDLNDPVGMQDFFTRDSKQAFNENNSLTFAIHTGERRVNLQTQDMRILLQFMDQEKVRRANGG